MLKQIVVISVIITCMAQDYKKFCCNFCYSIFSVHEFYSSLFWPRRSSTTARCYPRTLSSTCGRYRVGRKRWRERRWPATRSCYLLVGTWTTLPAAATGPSIIIAILSISSARPMSRNSCSAARLVCGRNSWTGECYTSLSRSLSVGLFCDFPTHILCVVSRR